MIDNPAYKGVWAPRKVANPNYFEDNTPVQSLNKIGGVGIELWTMTEDILFDNIYVGHNAGDAKLLAQETFIVKQKVEKAAQDESTAKADAEDEAVDKTFKEDPVAFIRKAIFSFIELARIDPVMAIKTKPETASALAIAILTLLGMFGTLFGVIGAAQQPITKVGHH